MTYNMLGMYSFSKANDTCFDIYFQIPDNCFYNFTTGSGQYNITIELNPGQTKPSTDFMDCSEKGTLINNQLVVNFEQCEYGGVIVKKPKINISE